MKISSEFSKYATHYGALNIIQNKVVAKLLSMLSIEPKNILDLGCGSGGVCRGVSWEYEHFVGVDFAQGMLDLHPKSEKVDVVYGDFNDKLFLKNLLSSHSFDCVLSASALQWAENLEEVFQTLQDLDAPLFLAIFTSNTFKSLNNTASLKSILRSANEVNALQKKYFDVDFEVVEYKLEFESTRDMFKYIKQSGVSGSRKVLNYRQTKKLMQEYPVNYLEFEVVFITSH